jgi:hypothetical protein
MTRHFGNNVIMQDPNLYQNTPELLAIPIQLFAMYDEYSSTSLSEVLSEKDASRSVSRKVYAVPGEVS